MSTTTTTTTPPSGHRGGATYDPKRDYDRLNRQQKAVWAVMARGGTYTIRELEEATGEAQTSISARLRDFRKPEFGGHTVERHYVRAGLFRYRLVIAREQRR